MKNLYDLSAKSNHVKFFKWMWGINPSSAYRTMCPYFWSYIGSIIIFPLIILWKVVVFIAKPIQTAIDVYADKQADEYIQELILRYNSASTDADFYKLFKSRCYKKYKGKLYWNENIDTDKVSNAAYTYESKKEAESYKRKESIQKNIDNFKYGSGGTIISYIIGGAILFLIGRFIYWFVHLFTLGEFVGFLKNAGLFLLGFAIFILVFLGFRYLYFKIPCDNRVRRFFNKIVFWRYIGEFFIMIGRGFLMLIDMIGNIYKKNCPTIHWD